MLKVVLLTTSRRLCLLWQKDKDHDRCDLLIAGLVDNWGIFD